MRYSLFAFALLTLIATSCVRPGKYRRQNLEYEAAIGNRDRVLSGQRDSIRYLIDRLNQEKGANRALLATQDKHLDRLEIQEEELDDLRGNLSNTSNRLSRDLREMQANRDSLAAELDSLNTRQQRLIAGYQRAIQEVALLFADTLSRNYQQDAYTVTRGAGEVILSVREDLLFKPRSVDQLAEGNPVIFRVVMDALQANPLLKLTVVGHTDNGPNPRRGTSNWEYAALRATRIAKELSSTYYLSPNRVIAASQGEYSPLKSNATEEGRAANRRIDFVLRNNVGNLLRGLSDLAKE